MPTRPGRAVLPGRWNEQMVGRGYLSPETNECG